jgi:hypothetical protein
LVDLVEQDLSDSSSRDKAVAGFCAVSLEHAAGLRTLVAGGYHTSAISLMRLQFEALARAMWLLYVANDAAIARLTAPLTRDNEQAAKNLPSVNEMVTQIGNGVAASKCPAAAHEMLQGFKENGWVALNSIRARRHSSSTPAC